jgi:hypothetical protein
MTQQLKASLGGVPTVTIEIDEPESESWAARVLDKRPADSFKPGPVTVTLLDDPWSGWTASAHVDVEDGAAVLHGTRPFTRP